MTVSQERVTCRVCHRPLRSLISIMEGVGPVCRKKVRAALEDMLGRVMRGEAEPDYQNAYAMSPDELQTLVERDVRQASINQARENRRPSVMPVTVNVDSVTRDTVGEEVTVTWIDSTRAHVQSERGGQYLTTESSCNCPDFVYRRSRNPERAREGCRHMQALRLANQEVAERRSQARLRRTDVPVMPVEIHETNRETFTQIDWTVEEQRERVLRHWKENRPHSGTFMSEDPQKWEELKNKASQEWEYKYEDVLGGTGNSFGLEIEVEFSNPIDRQRALSELHNNGITSSSQLQRYHSTGEPGMWRAERDGSLGPLGAEFVSPVLYDTPETWQQLEKVTDILRRNGAKVTTKCGGHIHLGIAPLDHRTYSWQRLARVGVAYEKQFFRMGGADSESYRRFNRPGNHRGSSYTKPLPSRLSFSGEASPQESRRRISLDRYTMFNTTNIDRQSGRPAIEMRYPNASLDPKQIQAQVQVANAVLHQAAVVRNGSPEDRFTPKFSEINRHFRQNRPRNERAEEQNFREFLDFIGNDQDRLAATWLWTRGRS